VNLAVEERGIATLLGANGAGKTTMLRAISNMMVRVSGEIRFAGERIDGKATEDIARLGVAHVPDGRGTFLELTVEENLRLGAYTRRDKGIATDFDRLRGYFPRLMERRRQQAGTLSGGE
jgi:branched-chain amino acid transport system ATP-binding protein